jgi:metallo-beta-lactamase class B
MAALMRTVALVLLVLASAVRAQEPRLQPDPPFDCDACAEWNAPHEPFRVFGNTYFVGPAGLGAVLVTSDQGHILLDGGLPQSAAVIDANIRRLGFRTEDVRLIVNSHAHFDHAGGIAALQRLSGAEVAASADGAGALERGEPGEDDPQYGFGREANAFPAVPRVRVVADRETLRVGPLAVTAHLTPGHTPGSTTWSWQSCEDEQCLMIVYADSLNPVSAPGFRFTGDATRPARVQSFRRSLVTVAGLPCQILLAVHPEFANMAAKLEQRRQQPPGAEDPFVDPNACRAYAAAAAAALDRRIVSEP